MEQSNNKNWYDKYYKFLLFIPIIIVISCLIYLVGFYQANGDFFTRDASLAGGTTITLQANVDLDNFQNQLSDKLESVHVRVIDEEQGLMTLVIDSTAEPEELRPVIEEILGYELNENNSSTEFTGASLSESFYKQLLTAIAISFLLMSLTAFILFRTFIPSIAIIFAAFSNIVMALTFVNIIGLPLSAAGVAAFLMLIGYSVDTDILLTTRVLKKHEGSVNERIYGAFKTGIFMTVTALIAVLPAFFIVQGLPDSFRQIFLILAVGLFGDIINTWLTNASILKWYTSRRGQ